MAKIGLNNFRYGFLTEASNGATTYGGAKTPGKAISCNVEVENSDASLYANDVLAESDNAFAGGTVTIGLDRFDFQTQADLLGHTYTEQDGLKRNANDTAPYVGLGRVVVLMEDNVRKYRTEFLRKVKFSEPSQENNTKGESVEFGTVEIEGTISALANGDWSDAKVFNTQAEAITYIETLLGTTGE